MAPTVTQPLPFVAGAHEHTEIITTRTFTPGSNVAILDPVDINAGGYLRSVYLFVSAVGGAGGTAPADHPFTALDNIVLEDNNGLPVFGPYSGYQLFLANLFGGYNVAADVRANPIFNVSSAGVFKYGLRVPVEIDHASGVGSLHNQASNATYRLRFQGNTLAALGTPTTAPAITVTIVGEYWTQPDPTTAAGKPVMTQPPLLGTTQYWSVQRRSGILAGANNIPVTRTGNLIRQLILVGRDASGLRSDACLPQTLNLLHDTQTLESHPLDYNIVKTWEKMVAAPGGAASIPARPAGVAVFPFTHFGEIPLLGADGDGAGWLPTTEATRLEISGPVTTGGGTIEVLTNDVAVIPVGVQERYAYGDATRHAA